MEEHLAGEGDGRGTTRGEQGDGRPAVDVTVTSIAVSYVSGLLTLRGKSGLSKIWEIFVKYERVETKMVRSSTFFVKRQVKSV